MSYRGQQHETVGKVEARIGVTKSRQRESFQAAVRRRENDRIKHQAARKLKTDEELERYREAERIRKRKARLLETTKKTESRLEANRIRWQEVQKRKTLEELESQREAARVRYQQEALKRKALQEQERRQREQVRIRGQTERRREADRIRKSKKRQVETDQELQRRREANRNCKRKSRQNESIEAAELRRERDRIRHREEHRKNYEHEESTVDLHIEDSGRRGGGDFYFEDGSFHEALQPVFFRVTKYLAQDDKDLVKQDLVEMLVDCPLPEAQFEVRVKQEPASDVNHVFDEDSLMPTSPPACSADAATSPHVAFGTYIGHLASLVPAENRQLCMKTVTDLLYSFIALKAPAVVAIEMDPVRPPREQTNDDETLSCIE